MTVRRPLGAAVLVVVALVLSACAGLPLGGPVHVGKAIDEVEGPPDFAFVPDGPVKDATPQQIVEGFIAAGSGPRGNWEVAQEFLTTQFRQQWQPQANVTVYRPGESSISSPAENEIVFTVDPVANVDATGSYEPAEQGRIPFAFSLAQEDGQWRISQAPDGIVLDANRFASVFQSYDLAYFDRGWDTVIPDVRWFPSTNPATRITAALVSGTPSPWLAEPGTQWPVDPTVGNHPIAGYHHLGGTRLGTDPASSVVDPDCRVHRYANLHVAGSSVFPTAGWANPTLTLVAMAIRLADRLSR